MTIEEKIASLEKRLEQLNFDLLDLTKNIINRRLPYYEIIVYRSASHFNQGSNRLFVKP